MVNWRRYSKKLPATSFVMLNLVLGIGHFVVLLAAGAFLPMLPYVAGSLGVATPYAVWGQSNYVLAMALAFLIVRPLMQRYGAKHVALTAYLSFALSGVALIAALQTYPLYVALRILQGFAAGLSIVPSLALLLAHYRQAKQRVATGLWNLAAFVPFSIGPALGGYFAYVLGDWRLMFLIFSALTLLVAALVWALVDDQHVQPEEDRATQPYLRQFGPLCLALLALQAFYNLGILTDMSSRAYPAWWMLAAFALCAWLFFFLRMGRRTQLVDFSLFACENFSLGLVLLCLVFALIQGSVVQYVLRLQFLEGYTAWHAGLLFLPLFLLSKPLSWLTHDLIHHGYDPRLLACLALFGFALSFAWMGEYMRPTTWESLLWPQVLEGAALGPLLVSMNAIMLGNVPESKQMHAVDLINSSRTLAAAWVIPLSDISWDRYAAHARSHLISPDVGDSYNFIAGLYPQKLLPGTPLFHELAHRLDMQSGWITFNAMFHILAVACGVAALLVWWASATHISHRVNDLERVVETWGEDS